MALFAVLVLALLSGCASTSTGQASGGDVAWSTGGGSSADADPVPSRPEISPAAPEAAQAQQGPEATVRSPSEASAQEKAAPSASEDGSDSPQPNAGTATVGAAQSMLDGLAVRGKTDRTGYDPQLFDWRSDADHNGCDTHNDVLRRDLKNLVIEAGTNGCAVTAGELDDKYLGESYAFERGSAKVDIDHIVSRTNAWHTGAAALSYDELREFANDPLNLLAVSSSLTRQKDAADAANWLPPNEDYRCEYVSRQIAVKKKYGLWVAAAEKDAMESVLATCADQPAFTEDVAWPQPGEGDRVAPNSAWKEPAERSSGVPSEDPSGQSPGSSTSDPTEETPGNSAGDSSSGDASTGNASTGDASTAPATGSAANAR